MISLRPYTTFTRRHSGFTPPHMRPEAFFVLLSEQKRPQKHSCCLRSFLRVDYFMLTSAPSASSFVLISSASALETPSFNTFGALSTSSFASFSPRPVISRTTLITLTLEAPADTSSTSNSSFSAAPPAASPPAAATTTPAAADTPNSSSQAFTSSFNSNTYNSLIASIISAVVNLAILISSIFYNF